MTVQQVPHYDTPIAKTYPRLTSTPYRARHAKSPTAGSTHENTVGPLSDGAREDVTVPDRGESCDGPVDGGDVQLRGWRVFQPVFHDPRDIRVFHVRQQVPAARNPVHHQEEVEDYLQE